MKWFRFLEIDARTRGETAVKMHLMLSIAWYSFLFETFDFETRRKRWRGGSIYAAPLHCSIND